MCALRSRQPGFLQECCSSPSDGIRAPYTRSDCSEIRIEVLQGAGGSVKAKPFQGYPSKYYFDGRPYMSRYISTVYVKCRNGSLKCRPYRSGHSPGALGRT